MSSIQRLRLGTRSSALARWQADWVAARLNELGIDVELVSITTGGDRQQDGPVGVLGSPGVFTKELQRALLDGRIDLSVHSLKDLPTDRVPGLSLAAVPRRAPVGDVLVCQTHDSLEDLPPGAVVGTGSPRRKTQLLHERSDLQIKDIRGNVDTRLRKLDQGDYDALVLAEAGLRRLDLAGRITQVLPMTVMLPAVGQGALGLETRDANPEVRAAVEQLNHAPSLAAVLAERTMLAALQGGCLAPVAAWGRVEDGLLKLTGRVLSPDGQEKVEAALTADPAEAVPLGDRVAEALIAQGATRLVRASRELGR